MKFSDSELMNMAIAAGDKARLHAPPNPWVGALLVSELGVVISEGHTQVPGESHAEVEALRRAGLAARGATMVVTLEPCSHTGRTGPCAQAIIDAGVTRVVVATLDPDPRVSGRGVEMLRAAGVEVEVGIEETAVRGQLAPYLWHRTTGRPYVVAKVASTLDGVVAMADGTSQWITSEAARRDAHVLRAQSQAIVVGAGTVRTDDPALTARLGDIVLQPLRVVLGRAPEGARVHPCLELSGDLAAVLDEIGRHNVLQVLVEGGPMTLSAFFAAGLVNHIVWYQAPAFAGARGTRGALGDLGTETITQLRRGRVVDVRRIGEDVRMDVEVVWH
ncbi:MAG TPA: bifunctional diaminohydroxyphosphoribosylaminopyrimidine deaminase/5-amino-6-(5-phosphoribosylamino)uracil reductase RibD [Acidimicrobiales bacterium]|nr:bifunctional diaminohydroxyphosphoribosylaminopyrimidine deaminase/5-amino-6-(5-phosphoribosylamino)uracil reductase RibD [Acidimicrobiales bacterium]